MRRVIRELAFCISRSNRATKYRLCISYLDSLRDFESMLCRLREIKCLIFRVTPVGRSTVPAEFPQNLTKMKP